MAAREAAHTRAVERCDRYQIDPQNMGLVIIVNNFKFKDKNKNRRAAEKDSEILKKLFLKIGYEGDNILQFENKTAAELNTELDNIKNSLLKKQHSTFVVCIMSRVENNKLIAYNGEDMNMDGILSKFCDQSCTFLAGKPKLIITQCGVEGPLRARHGKRVDIEDLSIPEWSDVLVLRTGRLRKIDTGSVFLPIFCDLCERFYSSTPVVEIMTLAMNRLAREDVPVDEEGIRQKIKELAAITWNTLRKNFYLCPIQEDWTTEIYDLKKGVAVIFLNFEFKSKRNVRRGSEVDVKNFKELCDNWNYTFDAQIDLSAKDIREYFEEKNLIERFKRDFNCVIIIVSSHGKLDDNKEYRFLTSGNDESFKVEDFIEVTRNSLHRSVIKPGCPTIYLFSTCHGNERLEREDDDAAEDSSKVKGNVVEIDAPPDAQPPLPVPKTADQFIGYAETKKHVAYRSPTEGTWYLSTLYKVLRRTRDDLNSAHTAAQRLVGEKSGTTGNLVQQPAFYSTLRNKLFLGPVVDEE